MHRILLMAGALALAGCSVTAPVAVIGQKGDVLVGTAYADMTIGRFDVSNGRLACGGRYDPMNTSRNITFSIACNDGRTGFGSALRESSGLAGHGTVRLDDGETADFVFGPAAVGALPKMRAQ